MYCISTTSEKEYIRLGDSSNEGYIKIKTG